VLQGKYTLAILNVLKLAGGLTVALLAGLLYLLMRKDKTKQPRAGWKEAPHAG
jgi:hypothetical protein